MGNCSCKGEPIVAAIDQRFESEADGSAVIHWLDASTWSTFGGKHALLHYFTLLGVDGPSTQVTLVARVGSDGKSWSSLEGLDHGPYDSTDISTTPIRVHMVPSTSSRLPPLVQLGLKVSATGGLGGIRATWLIDPLAGQGIAAIGASGSEVDPGNLEVLTGTAPIDLLGELDVIFGVEAPDAGDVDLETSSDGDTWFLASTLTFAAAGNGVQKATNLLRYVQLVNRAAMTGTLTWSLSGVTRG